MTKTIPNFTPAYGWDHGSGAEVLTLDSGDVVSLIRHALEHNPDGAPTLRRLFADGIDAAALERVAGPHYAVRVEARHDHDAENPYRSWDQASSFASLSDQWRREYIDLREDGNGTETEGPVRSLGEGRDFTADDIASWAIDGGNSYETDSQRLTYRLLHLDGARGIRNVGINGYSGRTHIYAATETGRLDHDAVAWVSRGSILANAPRPEGWDLAYSAAEGWEYVSDAEGLHQSAEGAVEAWAAEVVDAEVATLGDYLSGSVYGISVRASTFDPDLSNDPEDFDARDWEDCPDGDLWGIYGDDEIRVDNPCSSAYHLVVDAIDSDLAAVERFREAEARTREGHARLLETLTTAEADLLRLHWGARFHHLTSARQVSDALKREGLDLYYTGDDRWPSLGLRKDDDEEGRP